MEYKIKELKSKILSESAATGRTMISVPFIANMLESLLYIEPHTYNNLPDPDTEPEAFNDYLRENNKVVLDTPLWILIENSYIPNQLVLFSGKRRRYLSDCDTSELDALADILMDYNGKHIYINADQDKSVPNRLHLHIKL